MTDPINIFDHNRLFIIPKKRVSQRSFLISIHHNTPFEAHYSATYYYSIDHRPNRINPSYRQINQSAAYSSCHGHMQYNKKVSLNRSIVERVKPLKEPRCAAPGNGNDIVGRWHALSDCNGQHRRVNGTLSTWL